MLFKSVNAVGRQACGFLLGLVMCAVPLHAEAVETRTATGRVTQADQTPVARVLVSDGYTFTRTDAKGHYRLPLHERARLVMMINPSGFAPTQKMYHLLKQSDASSDTADQPLETMDFELAPLTDGPDQPFTFLHLSDTHIGSQYRSDRTRTKFAHTANRMYPRPAFVLETGDLSLDTVERMQFARQASRTYAMPYLPAIGNHDRPRAGSHRSATFESLFAPIYYAFTYHNHLFILLPWGDQVAQSLDWTRQLLEQFDEDTHVVLGLHHWDGIRSRYDEFRELLAGRQITAAFMGHYHVNQVYLHDNIPVYLTTSGVPYNRDLTRPSFNKVTAFPDGRITVDQRPAGYYRDTALLYPDAGGAFYRGKQQHIRISAYDSALEVQSARADIYDAGVEGTRLLTVELEQVNSHLWQAAVVPDSDWPAEVYLAVEVVDQAGHVWEGIHTVRPVRDAAQRPVLSPAAPAQRSAAADGQSPVELVWTYSVDGSFGVSAPVLDDGVIYVGVENFSEADRANPVLVAVDAVTGQSVWQHRLPVRSARTTPLVGQDVVLAQLDDGKVIALDRKTGSLRWQDEEMVSRGRSAQVFHRSSPARVGQTDALVGGGPMYSRLNLTTGEPTWRHIDRSGWRGWSPSSPVVGDGLGLLSIARNLQAVDLDTGEVRWEVTFPAALGGSPVVQEGVAYLMVRHTGRQEPHEAVAINLSDGQVLWHQPLKHRGKNFCPPTVVGDTLYMVDYDELVALDTAGGSIRWRVGFAHLLDDQDLLMSRELTSAAHYMDMRYGLVTGTPAVADGKLYLVTRTGKLMAFDLEQPALAWSYNLHTLVDAGPTVSGNAIYVAGRNGVLYALARRD